MEEKIYDIVKNDDGGLTAVIKEGVTCIEEHPFMPRLFEQNEEVTKVHIPNSLESCYICFRNYFPKLKAISSNDDNPNWQKFKLVRGGVWASEDQPRADLPYLKENGDGTLTLDIPEGVQSLNECGTLSLYERVTVINCPASMEEIGSSIFWTFRNLKDFHIHSDNPYFFEDDGALFTKDKKKMVLYLGKEGRNTYTVPDYIEEIAGDCFAIAKSVVRVNIGKNVRKIGNRGLCYDGCFTMQKIYIPPQVTELEGEIFDCGADSAGLYYPIGIVGGARGSAIEEYCNRRNIDFITVAEDGIDAFYAESVNGLRESLKKQIETEKEFLVDASDNGYNMRFYDGTLEVFVPDGIAMSEITVKDTSKINRIRRQRVKKLIIGARVTAIAAFAFHDYENLEDIYIGADVKAIDCDAFNGMSNSSGWGCPNVARIAVDEKNASYVSVDNVLYTCDMRTLVKYAPAKPELYFDMDTRVLNIGDSAFEGARKLQCLKVAGKCVSIGKNAFVNTCALRHAYFGASVTEWPEQYPFFAISGYDRPWLDGCLIIGGPIDSAVCKLCKKEGVKFLVITEEEIEKFVDTPLPEKDEDPYLAECEKMMIIDNDGWVSQCGEIGEQIIFPEGTTGMRKPIDLRKAKRMVLPSTMGSGFAELWTAGFGGPAPDFREFVVAEGNERYKAVEGHLCTREGKILMYAPAAASAPGVLPEGITAIDGRAFVLVPTPFEKLHIPASVREIDPFIKRDGLFYEVEVSAENTVFCEIEGSLFTKGGKTLLRAKISMDGYKVPDGTEVIAKNSFSDVNGMLEIPESVREINIACHMINVETVRVPKGSYAETFMKENEFCGIKLEIVCQDGEVEKWTQTQHGYGVTHTDIPSGGDLCF